MLRCSPMRGLDFQLTVALVGLALGFGCSAHVAVPDGPVSPADAGVTSGQDSGSSVDAGPLDAGPGRPDAGSVPITGTRSETPVNVRHIYSQIQAWTIEGLYFLAVDIVSGEGVVLHAGTWEEVARIQHSGHRWITGTHKVLTFDERSDSGAALYVYDVDTGVETELLALGHPGLQSERSQEEVDRAGQWVAVYIDNATNGGPRVVTVDLQGPRVVLDISVQALGCDGEPDWVGVDPTGTYLLVQAVRDGRGQCSGLWAYDITTGAPVHQLTDHHNHGTTGLGPNGRPYFLSIEYAHPNDNNNPGIFRYWIDTGESEVVGAPLPWGAMDHISCLAGPGEPCIGTGSNEFSTPYTGQLWRLDFDGERTIIEPHEAPGNCDYWGQSQATVGPGGRYAFATHNGDCNAIRDRVVQ